MKIVYGVVGGSLKLKQQKLERFNGTLEGYLYLWILARNPSIEKIYLGSYGDYESLTDAELIELDPRGVIENPFKEWKRTPFKDFDYKKHVTLHEGPHTHLYDYFVENNLTADVGIYRVSQGWNRCTIPNSIFYKPRGKENIITYTPRQSDYNYGAGLTYFINHSKIPYVLLAVDPRQVHPTQLPRLDTINLPIEIMSQISYKMGWEHIEKFADSFDIQKRVVSYIDVTYRGLEKVNNIFYKQNIIPHEKSLKMVITAMQSTSPNSPKDRRFDMLKKWILDYDTNKEVQIYGEWSHHFTFGHPQFKGFMTKDKVDELMKKTRYTFVIGIAKDWSTSKWADNLALDVIPFVAPDYDTQYNAIPKDSWIRVKTPKELYEKMEYLDANPEKRIQLIEYLKKTLFKDTENGVFLYKELNKAFSKIGLSIAEEQETEITRKIKIKQLF